MYNIGEKRNGVIRMSHGAEKTNAMRILEQKKAKYVFYDYTASGAVSGEDVAAAMGQDPGKVFKTLVTVGMSGKNYVFYDEHGLYYNSGYADRSLITNKKVMPK